MTIDIKVKEIISRTIKIPPNQLSAQSGLGRVDGWDSLSHTILVLELEKEFDIAFDFDELDKIITVEAIVDSLLTKGVTP